MPSIKVPPFPAARLELVGWRRPEGSDVVAGETLAELRLIDDPAMMDCVVEIPAPTSGKLRIVVHNGSVARGQEIGTIS